MPKRDPKTGKFQAADTGKPADGQKPVSRSSQAKKGKSGSRTAKNAGKRSRTGKAAVGIHHVRCRVGNRIVRRPATAGA